MANTSLFGYGKTTKALAKLIPNAVFYDDNCHKPFKDENGFSVKPACDFDPKYSELEITSPGIPPSNPLIQKAKNLISEYDYFTDIPSLKIWISGTNGKTTTTQMMQHLLKDKDSHAGGNIGSPLAELDLSAQIWILETSSFTIHYTNEASPNIYVLLPITPDHLSWHGNMQEYIDAKLKPLATMQEGDVAIIPRQFQNTPTNAHIIGYETPEDIASYFGFDIQKIKFKGAFLADALLAMAVDKILFDRTDYEKINTFELDSHRQEELYDSKGRLWVNDTKATNLDATVAAVKRYENSFIHLIIGGDDKGVELDELFSFLSTKTLRTYHIGSNEKRLDELAKKYNIEFFACGNLLDAVKLIDKTLENTQVALLSPAAASLDQFSSYAQRGDLFKEAVKGL